MDDTKKVLVKDHEGSAGAGEGVDDVAARRPILSEAEDTSDDEA